jgi:MFS family permease
MTSPARPDNVIRQLLPFSLVVFFGFLAIGIPLPVLPVQVGHALGYDSVVVGSVVGAQSLSTLLTRQFAGRLCDTRGPKLAALLGFACASGAALLYLVSGLIAATPLASLLLLVAGRLLLGLGESLFITSSAIWSIARVGVANAGRAMSWQGMAMYGAMAFGAPVGSLLQDAGGFNLVAGVAVIFPLFGLAMASRWVDAETSGGGRRASFAGVLGAIWLPGLALACASFSFGTMAAFLPPLYHAGGWSNPGAALTAFGVTYIAVRLFFSGVPDRAGGYRVAGILLFVQLLGQLLIWRADSATVALLGTAVTGLGYSLVFPSLGVEAMKRVPPENRGLVIGAYLACFDLALAVAGPSAGVVAQAFGVASAFLFSALVALCAAGLVWYARVSARRAMAPARRQA